MVRPSQVVAVVSIRSNRLTNRCSSGIAPPSPFKRWLRLNPLAILSPVVASGKRSPASWRIVN